MAEGTAFITLADLLEESADTEKQDRILDRIKLLPQESLPDGWTNWKTVDLTRENLFGDEQAVDPQVLNKIRFALPTVGIAKAFNPSANDWTKNQYRDYKVEMLNWAFCRALIMSPPAITNRLKGSAGQADLFLHAIKPIKHLFVPRIQAVEDLRRSGVARGPRRRRRRRISHQIRGKKGVRWSTGQHR